MKIDKKSVQIYVLRLVIALLGIFIMAVTYNMFYVPNNFVTGGVSGLAIVFNAIIDIPISAIVFSGNIFFIILSIATLGMKKSINNIIGALSFSLFVYLTQNISEVIEFSFSSPLLDVLCSGVIMGVGAGLVYKVDFTSGGTDILMDIFNQKFHIPMGKAMFMISAVIIIFGTYIFGFEMLIYALIIKYIESLIIDKIMLGISDSKMLLVESSKKKIVKKYLLKNAENGVTLISTKGGYTEKKSDMIMCIVPTEKYYKIKEKIKEIDPSSFIIISDCYEVYGGTKRKKVSITKYLK